MKKMLNLLLLLAVITALFLQSCGASVSGTATTAENTPPTPDSGEPTTSEITTDETTGSISGTKTTEEMISEIDKLTEARINEIRNTKDEVALTGTVYYISEDGNDLNDGKSPENAWKTMINLNLRTFSAGDVVLFNRGDTFRGHFKAQDGVTYASYGEGEKPRLIGNEITETGEQYWSLLEGTDNIWVYYKELPDQGVIVFNNGEKCAYKETPCYRDGKFYVQGYSKEFVVADELNKDLEFVCLADSFLSGTLPNTEDENCIGKLYLRCDAGNPGAVFDSIEFAPRVFIINAYANYVTIDNLSFFYTGAHAIGGGNCNDLTVKNCEFGWIGGCIQFYQEAGYPVRYGNAVQTVRSVRNYKVINNYIYQVYDAGITHQVGAGSEQIIMKDILYSDNVILYCTYSIEYFLGEAYDGVTRYMDNVVFSNNIMRYAGFGFGNQRGTSSLPAHIKGWDHANYLKSKSEFIIKDNIMDRSRYMMIHCGASDESYLPHFENNIWIQYKNNTASLGRYGLNPTSQSPFTLTRFEKLGVEEDPQYFVASKDWLWELPF